MGARLSAAARSEPHEPLLDLDTSSDACPLVELDLELTHCILLLLPLRALLHVRLTCRALRDAASNDALWESLVQRWLAGAQAGVPPLDGTAALGVGSMGLLRFKTVFNALELPLQPRPASCYNAAYFCDVLSLLLCREGVMGVRFHVRGDDSLGQLQLPGGSLLHVTLPSGVVSTLKANAHRYGEHKDRRTELDGIIYYALPPQHRRATALHFQYGDGLFSGYAPASLQGYGMHRVPLEWGWHKSIGMAEPEAW